MEKQILVKKVIAKLNKIPIHYNVKKPADQLEMKDIVFFYKERANDPKTIRFVKGIMYNTAGSLEKKEGKFIFKGNNPETTLKVNKLTPGLI